MGEKLKITSKAYLSLSKLEGVQFEYNKRPLEITDEGVIFIDVEEQEDGRITDIEGSETLYPANSVIISISQDRKSTRLNSSHIH